MAEFSAFTAHPLIEHAADPERFRRAFATLRSEFQAETDAGKRAAIAFELAKHHAWLDETAHAAREALQATNLASGFVEPIEMLIAISREKNSRGNLRKLLERLEKIATAAELRVRASLELCALCLTEGDPAAAEERARAFLGDFGEESEFAGPFLLLLERLAHERRDDVEVGRWARARARLTSTPDLRAELLERAARALERSGDRNSALDLLAEARLESDTERRATSLRRRLTNAGRIDEARDIARKALDGSGDTNELERAEALYELFATAPAAMTDEDFERLLASCRESAAAPDLLLVALVGVLGRVRERTDLVVEALALAERCPLETLDRGVLALTRALTEQADAEIRRAELIRAAEFLPTGTVPKAGLLLGIGGRQERLVDPDLGRLLDAPAATALARFVHERLTGATGRTIDGEATGAGLDLLPPSERSRFDSLRESLKAVRVETPASDLFSGIANARPPREESFDALDAAGVGLLRVLFGEREPEERDFANALTESERSSDPETRKRAVRDLTLARALIDHHRSAAEATSTALLAHAESDPEDPLALGIGLALSREKSPLRAARLLLAAAEAARARGDVEVATDLAERALVAALEGPRGNEGEGGPSREATEVAGRALAGLAAERHPLAGYLLARMLGHDGASARRVLSERPEWSEAFRLREALEGRSAETPSGDGPRLLTVPLERVVSPEAARWLRALAAPALDANGLSVDPATLLREGAGRLPEAHLAFLAFRTPLVAAGGFSALEDGALARELLPLARAWKEACADAVSAGSNESEALGEARLAWLTVALAANAAFDVERALDELSDSTARDAGENDAARPDDFELLAAWGRTRPGFSEARLAAIDALPWSDDELELFRAYAALTRGDAGAALSSFLRLAETAPNDPSILEGLRCAAKRSGDRTRELEALTALAQAATSDEVASELWESAGLLHLDSRPAGVRDLAAAEECFSAALARKPDRTPSYAMLYRIVRARGDDARLIELIDAQLERTDESALLGELLWEKAQLCRKLGRRAALDRTLTRLLDDDSDHLPALALAAEIRLSDGRTGEAASLLARIACHPEARDEDRETSGLHALDLFHGLSRPTEVLELSESLLALGVPEARLRERRARAAAELGKWELAYRGYRDLSDESDEIALRSLASKVMLVLQRDHLNHPGGVEDAARRVLRDEPTDAEAIDVVLEGDFSPGDRRFLLGPTLAEAKAKLGKNPLDPTLLRRYVEIATRSEIPEEIRLGLGLQTLVSDDPKLEAEIETRSSISIPTRMLTVDEQRALLPPEWDEPTGLVAIELGRALTPLASPSLEGLGLSVSMRVDPFSSSELRAELASLAALFGLVDFELYVGGSDPLRIAAFERDFPSLALGRSIRAPLRDVAAAEAGVALFALRHGLAAFLGNADEELLPWVLAFLDPSSDPERAARFATEGRSLEDAASRDLVTRFSKRGGLPEHVLRLARVALARALVFLYGDASILKRLSRFLPLETEARIAVLSEAIRFSLSEDFLGLRRKAGLEG